ncbi:hypothetical protein JXB41_02605 [Candidatus Woesearchaeota archaeon]|nr:hypothetical protein [Candidatus Woesearchaeota archaeon]
MNRLTKYQKKIKNKLFIQTVLILICVLSLIYFIYQRFRPEITELQLNDECGPIGNTISHSIATEESCINACNSACKSFKIRYHDCEFIYNREITCNNCTCYCKK